MKANSFQTIVKGFLLILVSHMAINNLIEKGNSILFNLSDILNNNLTDIISNVTNTLESNDSMAIFGQQIQPSSNNTNQLSIQQLNQNTNVFVTEDLQEKCSICNESFGDDPICRRNIICNHYFHRGCIDTWYSSHNKCPVCNINIVQN